MIANCFVRHGFILVSMAFLLISCGDVAEPEKSQEPSETSVPEENSRMDSDDSDFNIDEMGRAVGGYDIVSYFRQGRAIPGKNEYRHQWGNAAWLFSSPENRDLFLAEPMQYAPANGGYCTFGIILHKKLDGNPDVWHIKENRLYLFLNQEVKNKFLLDEEGNLQKVNDYWPEVKGTPR